MTYYKERLKEVMEIGRGVESSPGLTVDNLVDRLAEASGVIKTDFMKYNGPFHAMLRHCTFYLCNTRFGLSEVEIAERFDVAKNTVVNALRKIKISLADDERRSLDYTLDGGAPSWLLIRDDHSDLDPEFPQRYGDSRVSLDSYFLKIGFELSCMGRRDCHGVKAAIIYYLVKESADLSVNNVLSKLRDLTGINAPRLRGGDRDGYIMPVRLAAIKLYRDLGLSYPNIGSMLGGRDHSTIISGLNNVDYALRRYKSLIDKAFIGWLSVFLYINFSTIFVYRTFAAEWTYWNTDILTKCN